MKKITPAEFSRKMKLSRARVSQLMQGILAPAIIAVPGKKRVMLDEKKATALYKAFSDPAKQRTNALSCDEYSAARTEGEYYRAALVKQKYEQKLDRYIEK